MGQIVGGVFMSHTPFCFRSVDDWLGSRAQRTFGPTVPVDSEEECYDKKARIEQAFGAARDIVRRTAPNVAIVLGDDQLECFSLSNFPSLGLFLGDSYEGPTEPSPVGPGREGRGGEKVMRVRNEPQTARALLVGLMDRGFDPAFCLSLEGDRPYMGHAVMYPVGALEMSRYPIVPVLLNCYYAPTITGARSFQLGCAIRSVIAELPEATRVLLVASGGLWHTPAMPGSYLDEAFDREMLDLLRIGNSEKMAERFDRYEADPDDESQRSTGRVHGVFPRATTGPQGGTREVCAWIAVGAALGGAHVTVHDYIPVYASPIGVAVASWSDAS